MRLTALMQGLLCTLSLSPILEHQGCKGSSNDSSQNTVNSGTHLGSSDLDPSG